MRRTSAGIEDAAEFAGQPVEIEVDRCRGCEGGVLVGEAPNEANAGGDYRQEFKCPGQGADRVVRVLRFFEAHGGVGAEFLFQPCLANAGGVEIGALEDD